MTNEKSNSSALTNAIIVGIVAIGLYLAIFETNTLKDILNWDDTTPTEDTTRKEEDKPVQRDTTQNEDKPKEEPEKPSNYLPTISQKENQIVEHTYYTLSFVDLHKQPEWCAYELSRQRINAGSLVERTDDFRPDSKVKLGSASPADYKRSGYDRGHLVPAGDMSFDEKAMSETFFMSNMSPQVQGFNRGIWKELEETVRDWAHIHEHIYVVTGPILPKTIEGMKQIGQMNKVTVPKEYYKVILDYEDKQAVAYILPNADSDKPLTEYQVTIDEVEKRIGCKFFSKLTGIAGLKKVKDTKNFPINPQRQKIRVMEARMRASMTLKMAPEE